VIRGGNQRSSEVIRCHQRSSEAIRPLEVICESAVISGTHQSASIIAIWVECEVEDAKAALLEVRDRPVLPLTILIGVSPPDLPENDWSVGELLRERKVRLPHLMRDAIRVSCCANAKYAAHT
jgi:hypothetical protein